MHMKNEPIISVIGIGESCDSGVRCINSVLEQIFSKFEFLLEKPLSDSEGVQVKMRNLLKDERIIVLPERMLSICDIIKKARGKYVIFVDLRDEISIDYLRMMQKIANNESADIVVSDLLFRNKSGALCYYNLDPILISDIQYAKEEIYNQFCRYEPLCISWRLLNNKLFSRNLLLKCVEELHNQRLSQKDEITSLLSLAMKKAGMLKNVHQIYYILSHEHNVAEINSISGTDNTYDNFFQSIETELTLAFNTWDEIKRKILDPQIKYVSFDIFDTLILRNVFEPVDVFKFLNEDFNHLLNTKSFIDFSDIRRQGEEDARREISRRYPTFEDVTLDEIYVRIKEDYVLNANIVEKLKEKEAELEIRLCVPRQCGKQLYELAKYCGKKIIFTSDMYLPKEVVNKILEKNGYLDYDCLFLSSEVRLGKYSGNLYKYVKRYLKISEWEIMHIGDNWEVDVVTAQKNGFYAFHLPKGNDLMCHRNPGIYTGGFFNKIFQPNGTWIDGRCATDLFLGIRCMLSQVQNKFFDFPYMNFNPNTDFNANPYFIGYFVVGMHIYALVEWIRLGAIENGYKKIHFLARDGYLPLAAYRILSADKPDSPEACYTYMSRYIIALCDIASKEDIYALTYKMNPIAATPKKLFKLFEPAIPIQIFERAEEVSSEKGFIFEKPFETMGVFYRFVKFFCESCIDFMMLEEYQKKLKTYFTEVFDEKECFFDVGYNGRVESALTAICGYTVDSFCLHTYKEIAISRGKQQNFKTHTFYDYQPVSTFLLREQIFSKMAASATGLNFSKEPTEILFGNYDAITQEESVIGMIQTATIEFIHDYHNNFLGLEKNMNYRHMDASLPFESFMHYSREKDRAIFKCILFEDEFGDEIVFNLYDYWRRHLAEYRMPCLMDETELGEYYIYSDGALMKLYQKINRWTPKGSRKREWLRSIMNFFIR